MPRLRLKLLGAFQVLLDNKPVAGFDSDKTRALLAYLVVEAKQPHRRETLSGLLWPDVLEASARQSLSQALSNLRKLLRDAENEPPLLLTTRDTVQFNPEADYELDANPATIQQHVRSGTFSEQGDTLLPGFTLPSAEGFEEWLLLQREATQRYWIEALEAHTQQQLAKGQSSAAIATAQRLLQLDPWREQAHLYLMRAYAGNGQRSEALQQFEKCKKILNDELGIAPSAEVQTLAAQIKAGERLHEPAFTPTASPTPTDSSSPSPSQSTPARPTLLPNTLTPFVGRTRELAELRQLLAQPEVRLITLTGAGGMGKTRLAIQAASEATTLPNTQFTDGLVYVSLGNVREAERVAAVIVGALGLPADSQISPEVQLFAFLQEKAMLLILDNFEHLLATESSLAFLSTLFQSVAGVKLLVTSREALGAQGEWVCALTGLGDDAHALFVLSARRVRADLNFNAEDADIRRICHTLDGLPLGIELAASWVRVLSCKEIADELEQNLDLLESNARELPERHRSMSSVFEYSWRLLSEHERLVMMALSIFRGGFTREAAKQVAQASLLDLSALLSKSMIRRTEQGRYDLHNVVRQNARRHLSNAAHATEIADRHLAYFVDNAQTAATHLLGAEQTQWVQRLALELDNIRVALDWANANPEPRTQSALQLITTLQGYWQVQGHLSEMRGYLATAMQHAQRSGVAPALWAKALCTAGMLALWQDDGAAAGKLLEESRQAWISSEGHGAPGIAQVLLGLGEVASANSQYNHARERYEEAYRRFEATGDLWGMSESLLGIARHSLADGNRDGHRDGDGTGHDAGDSSRIVHNRQLLEQSLALKRQLHDARGTAWVLSWLSTLLHEQNDPPAARTLLLECLQIQEALGDRMGSARTLNRLAEGYRQEGDPAQADHYYTESLQRYRDLGSSRGMAMVLHNRAHVQLAQGHVPQAKAQFGESLRRYQQAKDIEGMALALAGLGAVALAERDLKRAVSLFASADAAMRSINYYFEATDRMEYEHHVAEAKAQLSADEFAAAWTAGSVASLDQVVRDAIY